MNPLGKELVDKHISISFSWYGPYKKSEDAWLASLSAGWSWPKARSLWKGRMGSFETFVVAPLFFQKHKWMILVKAQQFDDEELYGNVSCFCRLPTCLASILQRLIIHSTATPNFGGAWPHVPLFKATTGMNGFVVAPDNTFCRSFVLAMAVHQRKNDDTSHPGCAVLPCLCNSYGM